MINEWDIVKVDEVAFVTDFVANGSFASLRDNVTTSSEPNYAVLIRFTDYTKRWNGKYKFVDKSSYDFLSKSSLNPGDLVISNVGNPGQVFIVPDLGKLMTLGPNSLLIRPNDKIDTKYLYYYFQCPAAQKKIEDITSATAQRKFNKTSFRNITIPLPPLPVQKQIAAALEKADILRGQCQQMEQELNTLAQSVFLDMFGDPVSNPKKWDISNLDSICHDIYRYPTFYGFDYVEDGVPVVKIGNITQDGYVGRDLSLYDFMSPDKCNEYPRTILKMHDIVMAVRGDGSTGKRIGLVDSKAIVGANISPNLIMFRANEQLVHPIFLYYFLTSTGGQAKIEKYISKTAKKTITGKDIKKIEMYVPPISLQLKFVTAYNIYKEQLNSNVDVKNDSFSLFNSLMQKAFKGELQLKDVA